MADAPAERPCLHCVLSDAIQAYYAEHGPATTEPGAKEPCSMAEEILCRLAEIQADVIGSDPQAAQRIRLTDLAHDLIDSMLLDRPPLAAANAGASAREH